jgi:hypothetical protein
MPATKKTAPAVEAPEIKVSDAELASARKIINEAVTVFPTWLMADKSTVESDALSFRRAFALVAAAEEKATTKREDDPKYSEALKALRAKYPFLDQWEADLKALRAQFGGQSMSDELAVARGRYNSTARTIKDPNWGAKNIPTMNMDGSSRQPKNGAAK